MRIGHQIFDAALNSYSKDYIREDRGEYEVDIFVYLYANQSNLPQNMCQFVMMIAPRCNR